MCTSLDQAVTDELSDLYLMSTSDITLLMEREGWALDTVNHLQAIAFTVPKQSTSLSLSFHIGHP